MRIDRRQLLQIYQDHPISAERILARLARAPGDTSPLDERQLAADPAGGTTDQNHVGGLRSTLRLADLCSLRPDDRVLDVGCGIGGSSRVLAREVGCRVHGIDINPDRIRDAELLARLTGLDALVSFEVCGIEESAPMPACSVVWAQNSLMHVAGPDRACELLASRAQQGGRVALEEVCLLRPAANAHELARIRQLDGLWGGRIHPLSDWTAALAKAAGQAPQVEVERESTQAYLRGLLETAQRPASGWPASEVTGISIGHELAAAGLLGYFRTVFQPLAPETQDL